MPVTIKCFGEGVRLWLCETSTEIWSDWQSIREDNELEWEELFFNLSFLKKYGYTHWSELSKHKEQLIFFCRAQNSIEIKQNRKLLERFHSIEISQSNTLFPLYQTNFVQSEIQVEKGNVAFVLCQIETGTFAKYVLPEEFQFAELHFQMMNPFYLLEGFGISGIRYNGKTLKSEVNDTLVRSSRVYLLQGSAVST